MNTCSNQRRTKKNERALLLLALTCTVLFLAGVASSQIYLPPPPPEPSEYGKVVLDQFSSNSPGGVVFDHWLHRSKFTCRLCHVDIGFAMQAKATGIQAASNREGFHCGSCHDGKRLYDGKPIFAACGDTSADKQCDRCHSLGKTGVRHYEYKAFVARFPKAYYGVDWQAAERSKAIKPVDFLEGVSLRKNHIEKRRDFTIKAGLPFVQPIVFSHQKHSVWNGCELCHPEIFPTAKKEAVSFSMYMNFDGRQCGACHRKVAFPLNNCGHCHPLGPEWIG